jgi:hypothetical protein
MFSQAPFIFQEGPKAKYEYAIRLKDDARLLLPRVLHRQFKAAYKQTKYSLQLPERQKAFNIIDIPFPRDWVRMSKALAKDLQMIRPYWTFLVTFGKGKVSETHIEQFAASQITQLICGCKTWYLWSPGSNPKTQKSTMTIKQKAGEVLYVPGGWWHRVVTETNGALLVGVVFSEKGTPIEFSKCVRMLACTDTPQNLHAGIQMMAEQMKMAIPKVKSGDRLGTQSPLGQKMHRVGIRATGKGNTRMTKSGRIRTKRNRLGAKKKPGHAREKTKSKQ